jgi:hypothetical protein
MISFKRGNHGAILGRHQLRSEPEYATTIQGGLEYLHAKVSTVDARGRVRGMPRLLLHRGLGNTVARKI